ncbi:methyltransferase, FkbM family [Xaviernesmea oryzae]|uniref:Methyltransferase, FkbM family n=1 Tax=Xaviernesmea oryzae TaxID=464029 RepID=A0A1X7GRP9_9HYPH|nr:FkbM family methyltransferase [Xaviernesmea oryzae]SMF73705.1 methyltransferase, FkbM family [Xaviernesmea oryzae]
MRKLWRSLRKRILYVVNPSTIRIDGIRLAVRKGDIPPGVRAALFRGLYENAERNLLLQVLKPGMKTLEIGTGVGFISLLATRICGEGNVLSYEANGTLEKIIRRNYELNGLRPNLRMRAVTPDGQPVTFFRNENIISSSVYDRKTEAEKVTVQSDAFAAIISEFDPVVLIMDVEGAEIELFQISDFRNLRHMIVELHPHIVGQDKITALVERLDKAGFAMRAKDRKTVYFQRSV